MLHTIIKEFKELCSNKKIWVGILTVLIIIIIGTSSHVQKTSAPSTTLLKLGVINKDNSAYSGLLLSYFNSSETFTSFVSVVTGEEEEITEAYRKGKLDIYLVIPENFAENMMRLNNSPITVNLNISDTTKAILFRNVLKSYEKYITSVESNAAGLYDIMSEEGMDSDLINDMNRKVSMDLIFTALGKEKFFEFQPISQFPVTTLFDYYMGSILVMLSLFFGLSTGHNILKEMKQGTFRRILTTKTPLYQFLAAKLLMAIGILMAVEVVSLILLYNISITYEVCMIGLAIAMFAVSMAVLLSALFQTTQSFILSGNLIIFFFTLVGGGIIPIQFLPQDLLFLSKVTPYYYMLKSLTYIKLGQPWKAEGTSVGFIIISLCLLVISTLLLYKRSVKLDDF